MFRPSLDRIYADMKLVLLLPFVWPIMAWVWAGFDANTAWGGVCIFCVGALHQFSHFGRLEASLGWLQSDRRPESLAARLWMLRAANFARRTKAVGAIAFLVGLGEALGLLCLEHRHHSLWVVLAAAFTAIVFFFSIARFAHVLVRTLQKPWLDHKEWPE